MLGLITRSMSQKSKMKFLAWCSIIIVAVGLIAGVLDLIEGVSNVSLFRQLKAIVLLSIVETYLFLSLKNLPNKESRS